MCDYEFKKGSKKGTLCGVKVKDGNEKCGKHKSKKVKDEIEDVEMKEVGSIDEILTYEKVTGIKLKRNKVKASLKRKNEKLKRESQKKLLALQPAVLGAFFYDMKGSKKGTMCGVKSRDGSIKCKRHRDKEKELPRLPNEILYKIMEYVGEWEVKGSIDEKLRLEKETGIKVKRGKVKVLRAVTRMKRVERVLCDCGWSMSRWIEMGKGEKWRLVQEEMRKTGNKCEWRYGMWKYEGGLKGEWKIDWREERREDKEKVLAEEKVKFEVESEQREDKEKGHVKEKTERSRDVEEKVNFERWSREREGEEKVLAEEKLSRDVEEKIL
ncbi:hypothetical protein DFJ73DRAFT_769658 [Zopfochytrium polystomum]|nr:hypothetical protein DFJ73DRAFT_769658 [Zopfochytrium polystomum]